MHCRMTSSSIFIAPPSACRLRRIVLIAALSVACGVAALPGQIVAWNVSGTNAAASQPLAATVLDPAFASGTLSIGSGLSASSASNTFGGSGFDQTSLAGAMSAGDFLSVTITPLPGHALGLTSLTMLFGVSSAVTDFHVSLVSNVTGFTPGDTLWDFAFGNTLPAAQTVNLTGISSLQSIDSTLELRIYGWRDGAGTSTFRFRDNAGVDLSLAGTITAIPEPGTYAVSLGLVLLGVTPWAQRRLRRTEKESRRQ